MIQEAARRTDILTANFSGDNDVYRELGIIRHLFFEITGKLPSSVQVYGPGGKQKLPHMSNPIPGEEMHSSTVPASQMSQSVGQRELHRGDYWIGGYSRWGLKKFAVLGKKREKYFRVRDIRGMEKWVANFFQDSALVFVDAISPQMFRRYFPNHRWINVNNTKTGGKWS